MYLVMSASDTILLNLVGSTLRYLFREQRKMSDVGVSILLIVHCVQDGILSGPDDTCIEILEVFDWVDLDDFTDTRVLLDDIESAHFVLKILEVSWELGARTSTCCWYTSYTHVIVWYFALKVDSRAGTSSSKYWHFKCLVYVNSWLYILCNNRWSPAGRGTTELVVCRREVLLLKSILGCIMQAMTVKNMQSNPDHLFCHITEVIAKANATKMKKLVTKEYKSTLRASLSSPYPGVLLMPSTTPLTVGIWPSLSISIVDLDFALRCIDVQTAMRTVIWMEQVMAKTVGDGTVHIDREASNT